MSSDEPVSSPFFSIRIDNGIAVLQSLDKAFLLSQAKEFNRIFDELKRRPIINYVLDFSGCDYISSEGLSITAQCWKWCHDDGNGAMAAVVPHEPTNEVRKLFDIIGLSRMIGSALKPTLTDALKYLKEFS